MKKYLFVALSLLLTACVSSLSKNEVGYMDSANVTHQIRAELKKKLGSRAELIRVRAYRDEVQLRGRVPDMETRKDAGGVAVQISGVKHVRNNLEISQPRVPYV